MRHSGEARFYERRQLSLDVCDWQDIDEMAKARGQSSMKMLRELIEIVLHDNLADAIFDDGSETKRKHLSPLVMMGPRLQARL
jgi:hypothetical protein